MAETEYSELFLCPQTLRRLRPATEKELEALRSREGFEKLESALVRSDRSVAYPVKRGIPMLIPGAAISMRKTTAKKSTSPPAEQP
jgi:uncharacterized protein YbaR (Trm112 family)